MNDRDRENPRSPTTADPDALPMGSTGEPRDAANDPVTRPADEMKTQDRTAALFPQEELDRLKSQWMAIQAKFVDEPRHSVEEADGLVASTIKRLADSFANARTNLEGQWARGGDVSTEELRVALTRYRSFFDRLLAV